MQSVPRKNVTMDPNEISKILDELRKRSSQEKERQDAPPHRAGIRVPEVQIHPFCGDIRDYLAFKIASMSLIDGAHLKEIECFHLLKSKLREIIMLDVTNKNYHAAWEMLDARYDNVRIVVESNLGHL